MDDWHDAEREAGFEVLYKEFKPNIIEEFKSERISTFYVANPTLLEPAIRSLDEAREHFASDRFTAALILAVVSSEAGLKLGLLKPLVHGLVHQDSVAELVAKLIVRNTQSTDKLTKTLFEILRDCLGVNIDRHKRLNSKTELWTEMNDVQVARNSCIHQAIAATSEQAELALKVAGEVVERLLPIILTNLGFHVHERTRLCRQFGCSPENPFKSK